LPVFSVAALRRAGSQLHFNWVEAGFHVEDPPASFCAAIRCRSLHVFALFLRLLVCTPSLERKLRLQRGSSFLVRSRSHRSMSTSDGPCQSIPTYDQVDCGLRDKDRHFRMNCYQTLQTCIFTMPEWCSLDEDIRPSGCPFISDPHPSQRLSISSCFNSQIQLAPCSLQSLSWLWPHLSKLLLLQM
jgi:hypothetical protein